MSTDADLQAMSKYLVSLPPEEFAAAMLQWIFLQFLSKKGLREMTVALPGGIFTIGEGEPLERLRAARAAMDREISILERNRPA
ncbi:MAG: hypothetical protein M0Z50_17185 [Planctomycetia bacterium]|nr:hypothetical protein [Planctomycetia bacterium]